jgi:membrane dipeptidase
MHTTISDTARELYQTSIVMDNAFGFEPEISVPHKWDVVMRYAKAGFSHVSLAVATDATSLETTIRYLAEQTAYINAHPEHYILVKSVADILRAKQKNKFGISFMFQGTNPIAKDLHMVDIYYQLGVRSMILAYNIRNPMGDGCTELTDAGLSRLGSKLIEKMNQTGMLIDCSHTGYRTSLEAMEQSKKPVIFSHSNVYAIYPHPRNLKDEQIIACAKTGGFIGINGVNLLTGDENASLTKYIEHIEYIADLVGPQHIVLGTDLIYFPDIFGNFMQSNSIMYPTDYIKINVALMKQPKCLQPEQIIELVEILIARGFSTTDVKGILGENYLRVIKQVWQ